MPHNTPAVDYTCPACRAPYQLKSQSKPLGGRILDAGYEQMCRAIREDRTPNLLVLHYDPFNWRVRNLILIPRFAFSNAAVEKRPPLRIGARRAGWMGCNILLGRIPPDARLALVENGRPADLAEVRRLYERVKSLAAIGHVRDKLRQQLQVLRDFGLLNFAAREHYRLRS